MFIFGQKKLHSLLCSSSFLLTFYLVVIFCLATSLNSEKVKDVPVTLKTVTTTTTLNKIPSIPPSGSTSTAANLIKSESKATAKVTTHHQEIIHGSNGHETPSVGKRQTAVDQVYNQEQLKQLEKLEQQKIKDNLQILIVSSSNDRPQMSASHQENHSFLPPSGPSGSSGAFEGKNYRPNKAKSKITAKHIEYRYKFPEINKPNGTKVDLQLSVPSRITQEQDISMSSSSNHNRGSDGNAHDSDNESYNNNNRKIPVYRGTQSGYPKMWQYNTHVQSQLAKKQSDDDKNSGQNTNSPSSNHGYSQYDPASIFYRDANEIDKKTMYQQSSHYYGKTYPGRFGPSMMSASKLSNKKGSNSLNYNHGETSFGSFNSPSNDNHEPSSPSLKPSSYHHNDYRRQAQGHDQNRETRSNDSPMPGSSYLLQHDRPKIAPKRPSSYDSNYDGNDGYQSNQDKEDKGSGYDRGYERNRNEKTRDTKSRNYIRIYDMRFDERDKDENKKKNNHGTHQEEKNYQNSDDNQGDDQEQNNGQNYDNDGHDQSYNQEGNQERNNYNSNDDGHHRDRQQQDQPPNKAQTRYYNFDDNYKSDGKLNGGENEQSNQRGKGNEEEDHPKYRNYYDSSHLSSDAPRDEEQSRDQRPNQNSDDDRDLVQLHQFKPQPNPQSYSDDGDDSSSPAPPSSSFGVSSSSPTTKHKEMRYEFRDHGPMIPAAPADNVKNSEESKESPKLPDYARFIHTIRHPVKGSYQNRYYSSSNRKTIVSADGGKKDNAGKKFVKSDDGDLMTSASENVFKKRIFLPEDMEEVDEFYNSRDDAFAGPSYSLSSPSSDSTTYKASMVKNHVFNHGSNPSTAAKKTLTSTPFPPQIKSYMTDIFKTKDNGFHKSFFVTSPTVMVHYDKESSRGLKESNDQHHNQRAPFQASSSSSKSSSGFQSRQNDLRSPSGSSSFPSFPNPPSYPKQSLDGASSSSFSWRDDIIQDDYDGHERDNHIKSKNKLVTDYYRPSSSSDSRIEDDEDGNEHTHFESDHGKNKNRRNKQRKFPTFEPRMPQISQEELDHLERTLNDFKSDGPKLVHDFGHGVGYGSAGSGRSEMKYYKPPAKSPYPAMRPLGREPWFDSDEERFGFTDLDKKMMEKNRHIKNMKKMKTNYNKVNPNKDRFKDWDEEENLKKVGPRRKKPIFRYTSIPPSFSSSSSYQRHRTSPSELREELESSNPIPSTHSGFTEKNNNLKKAQTAKKRKEEKEQGDDNSKVKKMKKTHHQDKKRYNKYFPSSGYSSGVLLQGKQYQLPRVFFDDVEEDPMLFTVGSSIKASY